MKDSLPVRAEADTSLRPEAVVMNRHLAVTLEPMTCPSRAVHKQQQLLKVEREVP